ncbi:MAG: hypothetical protein QOI55_759, partial [Actinomycetota bacterium]|nr:hypothetical protein [Actinomycetota bacterium]
MVGVRGGVRVCAGRRLFVTAMVMAVIGVVAVPSASGALPASGTAPTIVGGDPVGAHQIPSLAALLIPGSSDPRDRLVCSGTVVAPDVVMSAGHCIDPLLFGYAIEVQTGSRDLGGTGSTTRRVVSAVVNRTFWYTGVSSDIALFKLASSQPSPASRLALGTDIGLTKAPAPVQIAGWGLTTKLAVFEPPPFDARPPTRARVVTVPIVSDAKCEAAYADLDPTILVRATDICAGVEGKDACYGDSGGPMYATDPTRGAVQIGVVSRGAG